MIASVSQPGLSAGCHGQIRDGRAAAAQRPTSTGGYEQGVLRSIRYMVQHQDQPLQVAHLASVANICPSHYFAVFKQVTGFTPMAFFIRLRMRQACRLLETTQLSVKQIAAALGYDDPFYFSRLFKSVNGLPPTDYRASEHCPRSRIRDAVLPLQNDWARMLRQTEDELSPTAHITFS
jgi:transcriptional regulator GlxA family with amidase domain